MFVARQLLQNVMQFSAAKKKTNLTISINKFYGASEQALLIRVWIVCHKVDK